MIEKTTDIDKAWVADLLARHAKACFESAKKNPTPYSEAFHTIGIALDAMAADIRGEKPESAIE